MTESANAVSPAGVPGEPGQRRLRVAHIITGLELGGGGAVTVTMANAIDKTRFELDVFCVLQGGPMEEAVRNAGCKVEVFDKIYDYHRRFLLYSPLGVLKLAAAVRRGRYDVVHTHLFHADVVGRIAGLLDGVPVIVKTLHNMGRWKPARYLMVDRLLNRWTDQIICCSDYQREVAAVQEHFAPDTALTIPHGVRLARFRPQIDRSAYAASLGLVPGRMIVGTVGRPISEKGHDHLLDAIPQILSQHPDTEFLIVGDGDLRDALEARSRGAEFLGRVHVVGSRTDIPELLALMDVFVFPSLSEGFGIAVIEAMASCLPVVASNIRPLSDIIGDEVTGLLVPPGDAPALAGALNRLLSDEALRVRLAAAGRQLIEDRYTDRHTVGAHEDLYVRLLRAALAGKTDRRRQPQTPSTHGNRPTTMNAAQTRP